MDMALLFDTHAHYDDASFDADREMLLNALPEKGVYRVIVTDSDGDFVPGVRVQFCSDSFCMMGKTDADGLATFEVPEGNYTVHILKVPEGYEKNPDEFTLPATYSDLSIVLKLS